MGKLSELAKSLLVLREEHRYWIYEDLGGPEQRRVEGILQELFEKLWTELIDSCVYLNHSVLYVDLGDKNRGRLIRCIRAEELKFSFLGDFTILCQFPRDKESELIVDLNRLV